MKPLHPFALKACSPESVYPVFASSAGSHSPSPHTAYRTGIHSAASTALKASPILFLQSCFSTVTYIEILGSHFHPVPSLVLLCVALAAM